MEKAASDAPVHIYCVYASYCKYVYKKPRSTSQKATLKPANKALAKFSEVTQGTVSGGAQNTKGQLS